MPRPKKDREVMRAMCVRLSAIMDFLGMSDKELSEKLGYSNPTTIASVRRGNVFFDAERLALLAALELKPSVTPNLHWILTGYSSPIIVDAGANIELASALALLIKNKANADKT